MSSEKSRGGGRMEQKRVRSIAFRTLRVVALAYAGLMVLMAGCQKRYIYYPQKESEAVLLRQASAMGVEPWRDERENLVGWVAPAPEGEGPVRRVIVFHGNAGMALHRSYYAEGFHGLPGRWEVRLFEYPGYGARSGSPGERAFYRAAGDALRQLGTEGGAFFLLGESLGSGVACRMAVEFPDEVKGLILVTPFTDLAEVGASHFPFLPVRLLLRERYDNVAALEEFSGPVAILLAEHDEVIPAETGRRLYEIYAGPKQLWIQEGRTHNTLDLAPGVRWWQEVTDFLLEQQE